MDQPAADQILSPTELSAAVKALQDAVAALQQTTIRPENLPVTLPSEAGVFWNNGGTVAIS